jgi:hypothetical protein
VEWTFGFTTRSLEATILSTWTFVLGHCNVEREEDALLPIPKISHVNLWKIASSETVEAMGRSLLNFALFPYLDHARLVLGLAHGLLDLLDPRGDLAHHVHVDCLVDYAVVALWLNQ